VVVPLTPFEIAMSKIWANAPIITIAVGSSLWIVVQKLLGIPFAGSVLLFFCGVMLYLFFATAVGIFLATIARTISTMPFHLVDVVGRRFERVFGHCSTPRAP
jgi:ABC-2 type transport system permease protein